MKKNIVLLFAIIGASINIANATEEDGRKDIETRSSIIKTQDEEYRISLFNDCVTKNEKLIKLEAQLETARSNLKASQERSKKYPGNPNLELLCSNNLEIFNTFHIKHEKYYNKLVNKFNLLCCENNNVLSVVSNTDNFHDVHIVEITSPISNQNFNNNFINFSSSPLDIQWCILGNAFVSNILEFGNANNLKLVCKNWHSWLTQEDGFFHDLVKDFSVEITEDAMYDKTGSVVQNLKNNPFVCTLTFNFEGYIKKQWDDAWYNNHNNLIIEGLQNKPNLKILKIKGDCIVSNFLNKTGYVSETSPEIFLNLPHLVFLKTLEEFHVTGILSGSSRQDAYFAHILSSNEWTPKLQIFIVDNYQVNKKS